MAGKNKKAALIFTGLAIIGAVYMGIFFPWRPIIIKHKLILVELARTPAQREKGLKGRRHLSRDQGMLFIFKKEKYLEFWMKDTLIALSIAYVDKQKTIIDIQKMESLQADVLYPSAKKSKYALEMNLGWFEKNGIGVGDKLLFW